MDTHVNSLSLLQYQFAARCKAVDDTFSATSAFRVVSKTAEGKLTECVILLPENIRFIHPFHFDERLLCCSSGSIYYNVSL